MRMTSYQKIYKRIDNSRKRPENTSTVNSLEFVSSQMSMARINRYANECVYLESFKLVLLYKAYGTQNIAQQRKQYHIHAHILRTIPSLSNSQKKRREVSKKAKKKRRISWTCTQLRQCHMSSCKQSQIDLNRDDNCLCACVCWC